MVWLNIVVLKNGSPRMLRGPSLTDLLEILRDGVPRTRAELANLTGLARTTIGNRVDALFDLEFVQHIENAASTGGRPSSLFTFNPRARVVVAMDLGASHVAIALVDLSGSLLITRRSQLSTADGTDAVFGWAFDQVTEMLQESGYQADRVVGWGLGVPEPVSAGLVLRYPAEPAWSGSEIPRQIRSFLDVPVLIDNDVNMMALGESVVREPATTDLIFVKVATGIGAGIISGGRLQRGARGVAGDIGHILVRGHDDVPCFCGNTGCLQAVASGGAIAARLRDQGIDAPNAKAVATLVRAGVPEAIRAVRQAGRDLGEVLSAGVGFINPSHIVIGGSIADAGEHLLAGVREVVYTHSMPLISEQLTIVASHERENSALLGAGILVIEHVFAEGLLTDEPRSGVSAPLS